MLMVCFGFVASADCPLSNSPICLPLAINYLYSDDDVPSYTLIHCPKPIRRSSDPESSPAARLEAIASLLGDLDCGLDDIEASDDYLSLTDSAPENHEVLDAEIEIVSLQSQLNWATKRNKGYERLNNLQAMENLWTNDRCEVPEWLV
jgi:hypothetical protein